MLSLSSMSGCTAKLSQPFPCKVWSSQCTNSKRHTTIYPPIQSHLYTRKSLQLGAPLGNTWFVWLGYQLIQERVLLEWQTVILGGFRAAYRNSSPNCGLRKFMARSYNYILLRYRLWHHEHAKQKVCEFEGKTFKVMHNDDRCLSCGWQFLCLILLFDTLPLNRLTCNRRLFEYKHTPKAPSVMLSFRQFGQ
jgi:hypothetical protein